MWNIYVSWKSYLPLVTKDKIRIKEGQECKCPLYMLVLDFFLENSMYDISLVSITFAYV